MYTFVFSQSFIFELLSLEILRRYAARVVLQWVVICFLSFKRTEVERDLSCFIANGQTSKVRHWHGTNWQRTRAMKEGALLG